MFDYRALCEIQLQVSVDFLRVVQFRFVHRSTRGTICSINGPAISEGVGGMRTTSFAFNRSRLDVLRA